MTKGLRFVTWLLCVLGRKRFEIGRIGDVYLTRWTLVGKRAEGSWRVFLHCFHRSDYAVALHDHPWPFVSLILWPGYFEHTNGAQGSPQPSGNGRSGRALWLRMMGGIDKAPLGFLHHWYYQSLDASRQ